LTINIGFIKLGNIGTAPLVEFLLDERAEREDISSRVIGTGSKIGVPEAEEASKKILELNPDLIVLTTPNASLRAPKQIAEIMFKEKKPCIIISDSPAKKSLEEYEEKGVGYLIVEADSMIGARREFLDPEEMALFNADVIRVLAITGTLNAIREAIDTAIDDLKKGKKPALPKLILNTETAVESAGFKNPYAKSKAAAAYEIACAVAKLSVKGCFKVNEWKRYIQLVSTAHELMRTAANLADEAREIEKYGDSLLRMPHADDGSILYKRALIEKPKEK
jgi:methylenetetrahydromethanopterin dehydrogenase